MRQFHHLLAASTLLLIACGGKGTTTTEPVPVASVSIGGLTGPLTAGKTVQLTTTILDAGGSPLSGRAVTWGSSANAIATVTGGLVTAVSAGTTTITATSEGKSGTVTVTVNAATVPVASVVISGANIDLFPTQTLQLTAVTRDASGLVLSGRTVTWQTSAGGVATISTTGLITAQTPGSTLITASCEGKRASVTITVDQILVASVVINAPKTAFVVGDAASNYTATVKDAQGNILTGRTVDWSITPLGIATVSASGAVTALAPGNATVTAKSEGVNGTVAITVTASNAASLLEQRVLAQQGLAIALASTVLQTQLYTLIVMDGADPANCLAIPGGGAIRIPVNAGAVPTVVSFFFDTGCTRPYMVETVTTFTSTPGGNYHLVATGVYTGPTGTPLGSILFDETANNINIVNGKITGTVNGLGTYTSPSGAPPVQLGLNCDFTSPAHNIGICQGGIQQNFPALNTALGSVASLALDSTNLGVLNFTGGSALKSGALSSLSLTQPTPTSMLVNGGTPYGTATAGGGAASFSLFPPTPTGWTVTDAANDMIFTIGLVDNATRTLTATLKRVSTGATLATLALDQSGTGTVTYSNGLVAAVTSWMLSQ